MCTDEVRKRSQQMEERTMKGYAVKVLNAINGKWYFDSDAKGVNLLYAEAVAEYDKRFYPDVKIVNLDEEDA